MYRMRTEIPKELMATDFLKQDVLCDKTKKGAYVGYADIEGFTIIGEYTIPNGVATIIGRRFNVIDKTGGKIVVLLYDATSTLIHGSTKLVALSPQKDRNLPIAEVSSRSINETEPLNTTKNQTWKIGLDVPPNWIPEHYHIQLRFKPEQDGVTIDHDNSKNVVVIDILERLLK